MLKVICADANVKPRAARVGVPQYLVDFGLEDRCPLSEVSVDPYMCLSHEFKALTHCIARQDLQGEGTLLQATDRVKFCCCEACFIVVENHRPVAVPAFHMAAAGCGLKCGNRLMRVEFIEMSQVRLLRCL